MTKYFVTNGKGEFYHEDATGVDYGAPKRDATAYSSYEKAESCAETANVLNMAMGASDAETDPFHVVDANSSDYSIHTDSSGRQYQIMSGRELIKSLADDAMQDEEIFLSYACVGGIVPNKIYRAYIDEEDSALSGEWVEVRND